MDYKEIIKKAHKYHYYFISTNKIGFLSSSNSKSEAKKLALEKLKPSIDNLIGNKLVFVKIKSVANKYEKEKISGELKLTGGPILFNFERGLIKTTSKIENFKEGGNKKIYLSNKYIKKHQDNIAFDMKKLVSDVMRRKINQGLMALTIL